MKVYWLSFVDRDRPDNQQLLGVLITPEDDILPAVKWAHKHDVNPGGEVLGSPWPDDISVPADCVGRLFSSWDEYNIHRLLFVGDEDDVEVTVETRHPATILMTPTGDHVEIDSEIVPLISWLWSEEFITFNSCQNDSGYVWISFLPEHAERFLALLANCDDPYISERARKPFCLSPQDRDWLTTDYQEPIDYWLLDVVAHSDDEGDDEVWFTVSIRFPCEQLTRVMSAFGAI